jgi:hypothetical protein
MKLYKLTDEKHQTNKIQWGENVTHTKEELSMNNIINVIHAYVSPLMASFFKPVQVPQHHNVLWECEGDIYFNDRTKVSCAKLTTIKIIKLPDITSKQRAEIANNCVKEICLGEEWDNLQKNWLLINYDIYYNNAVVDFATRYNVNVLEIIEEICKGE